jgi:hypothetical protein
MSSLRSTLHASEEPKVLGKSIHLLTHVAEKVTITKWHMHVMHQLM